MQVPHLDRIIDVMKAKSYKIFETPNGHDLNIVGIRSKNPRANSFDDLITAFCRFQDQWCYWAWPATTDPGAYWLEHPMTELGTAILAPGQIRGAFKMGQHHGKYDALVQAKPFTVFRDPDRDREIDTEKQVTETGFFGINLHCAKWKGVSIQVDKWSAGCQVMPNWFDFEALMALAGGAVHAFGNSLTYTLLLEKDF